MFRLFFSFQLSKNKVKDVPSNNIIYQIEEEKEKSISSINNCSLINNYDTDPSYGFISSSLKNSMINDLKWNENDINSSFKNYSQDTNGINNIQIIDRNYLNFENNPSMSEHSNISSRILQNLLVKFESFYNSSNI